MTISTSMYEFKSRDGIMLDGILTANTDNKKKKLIIMIPGLTGVPQQYMLMKIRDEFIQRGFDSFSANAYGRGKRSLLEINMQRHAEDFDDMVAHFSKEYDGIYALGHSIAGRILLLANNALLKKQILLDPAGNFDNEAAKEYSKTFIKHSPQLNTTYLDWDDGIIYPVGPIANELVNTPFSVFKDAIKNLKLETLVIAAQESDIAKVYQLLVNDKLKYVEVPEATHCFWEYGTASKAADEMHKFLLKTS